MSQDLNPSTCSSLVIFMSYACQNHTINATPTERLRQHPLVFAMNRTYCTFFLWRFVPGTTFTSWSNHCCCDWKGRAASSQSFTLWQQAIKIPCCVHLISACSRHMAVVLHAHPVRG